MNPCAKIRTERRSPSWGTHTSHWLLELLVANPNTALHGTDVIIAAKLIYSS